MRLTVQLTAMSRDLALVPTPDGQALVPVGLGALDEPLFGEDDESIVQAIKEDRDAQES